MSMPISVCNDTFKINNVVFLPTKDVKKENHAIWALEYSDNAVFIVDASTWDEIDEVIKETIRDMHSENAVLKRISSFTNLQDSHGLVMQEGRLGEIAKHFDLETIYPYAKGFTCLETETIAFCCKVNILEKTMKKEVYIWQ